MIIETKINPKNKNKEELIMLLNDSLQVIQKQQAEIEKKDKMIDLMAKELVKAHKWFYSEFDNYTKEDFIKYFEKKSEEE